MSKQHNADHYYLTRADQKRLREKLEQIPDLVDDLAITTTRQDHTQRSDLERPRRPKRADSALPFHIGAASATHELHNCLATWVRLVCEHRAIDYGGRNSIIGLARWLHQNMIALALTPGSEEAYEDIAGRILDCTTVIDLPAVLVDPDRIEAANRSIVTADNIARVAADLGEMGEGLSAQRIRTLVNAGVLKPAGRFENRREKFYRLGDVLDAHTTHPRREQRTTA